MAIAKPMLKEQQYEFSEEAEKVSADYLSRRIKQPRLANARSLRKAIERAVRQPVAWSTATRRL